MPKGQYVRKPPADITGQVFGRWTVTGRSDRRSGKGVSYWVCECTCGVTREVLGSQLRNGTSVSCGCFSSDATTTRFTTHGKSDIPEHRIWIAMRSRCSNPNTTKYHLYGGRGIKVCKRWGSFAKFLADMGPRPSAQHSIERLDRDVGYKPSNCYWATPTQQNRNTSRNRYLTHDGVTLTVAEWAERLNLTYSCLSGRIHRGWTVERAISTPHR